MSETKRAPGLDLVALVGAGEAEVVVLAELHRNPRVHVVGVYDSRSEAVGHDLAEILGLRHGYDRAFLEQIASANVVVLPRELHQFAVEIEVLRDRGCELVDHEEALRRYTVASRTQQPLRPPVPAVAQAEAGALEDSLRWLERALDREVLLRSLLSIAVQAVRADKGSIQLFDPYTQQLYIAYAEGLSDHTVRASRQCLGEGIAGRVASQRRAELLRGSDARALERDRPDIHSAICTPLEDEGELLGVLNVSTDLGSRQLTRSDMDQLVRMADRIAPVLRRLLQIQSLLDRALVEDLERELDSVLALDPPVEEGLALLRDLVQDLSGASSGSLVVITEDGPAFQVRPGRDESGAPQCSRDVDLRQGILGQVVLDTSPVLLEEKNRRAGEARVRRDMTLYMPLGSHEPFAVLVLHFEGLSAIGHFQRNLDRVQDIVAPRLGQLLSRHESRQRHERTRRLAAGLSRLAVTPPSDRSSVAATLFMELSGAEAVAIWRSGAALPESELRHAQPGLGALDRVWSRLRERIDRQGTLRARELDPAGSELRSVLLLGSPDGPVLAALNRRPEDALAEWGFRDEDLECAQLLLDALGEVESPASHLAPAPQPVERPHAMGRRILEEVVQREMVRAQRYHLGFSLNVFSLGDPSAATDARLRDQVERSSRNTDAVLWLEDGRLVILAPEEMRGQRQLVRRVQTLLTDLLRERRVGTEPEVSTRSAAYPRDATDLGGLLERCLGTARD